MKTYLTDDLVVVVSENANERAKLKRRGFKNMLPRLQKNLSAEYRATVLALDPGVYVVRGSGDHQRTLVSQMDWHPADFSVREWRALQDEIIGQRWQDYFEEKGL